MYFKCMIQPIKFEELVSLAFLLMNLASSDTIEASMEDATMATGLAQLKIFKIISIFNTIREFLFAFDFYIHNIIKLYGITLDNITYVVYTYIRSTNVNGYGKLSSLPWKA